MGAGTSISLLTPQPSDFVFDVCEGQGSQSDKRSSPDCDPGGSAVLDGTQSSQSPMLVDPATDTETAYEPFPVLGLDMDMDNYLRSRDFNPETENPRTSESGGIFTCNACGYTSPDKKDLDSHIEVIHGNPGCGTCAPLCWGSCGKEFPKTETVTSPSQNNHPAAVESIPGSTRPHADTS